MTAPSLRPETYDLIEAIRSCPKTPLRLRARAEAWLGATFDPKDLEGRSRWNPHLFRRIDDLELSVRAQTRIKAMGDLFVWELVQRTEADLLRGRNFARRSLDDVKAALDELGLSLGMLVPDDFPRPLSPFPDPPEYIMSFYIREALNADNEFDVRHWARLAWGAYADHEVERRDWYRRTCGKREASGS